MRDGNGFGGASRYGAYSAHQTGGRQMTTELRLYTVNKGMMDEWLESFRKYIMPTSAKFGIKIHFAFVNRPQNEFIWSRSYDTQEALDAYMKSPDRAAYADLTGRCIAK